MRHAKPISCLLLLLWVGPTLAVIDSNESYVCLSEASTGFKLNELTKTWESATFSTRQKYIIKRLTWSEKAAEEELGGRASEWQVMKVGVDISVAKCRDDFSRAGMLFCRGSQDFRFSKKTLRFLSVYFFGYLVDGPSHRDTPFMELGVCDKIQ